MHIDSDQSWSSVVISYIITARKDMSVGFFALSGFQLVRAGSGYQYEYGLTDFGAENQNKNVNSAAFLSGITTTSTKIA